MSTFKSLITGNLDNGSIVINVDCTGVTEFNMAEAIVYIDGEELEKGTQIIAKPATEAEQKANKNKQWYERYFTFR